jgi:hypothetical protein
MKKVSKVALTATAMFRSQATTTPISSLLRYATTRNMSSVRPVGENSCISHWQATNRGRDALYGHNDGSTSPVTGNTATTNGPVLEEIPEEADIVIVGGGTMGASLAYFLTRQGAMEAGKKVVVLEARDIASGASGRNGVSGWFCLISEFVLEEEAVKDVSRTREEV